MLRVEKYWTTKAGLSAMVVVTNHGHRCGYVQVPKAYEGMDYLDFEPFVECHGGCTFANTHEGFEGWWLGFDCAHAWDSPDPELMEAEYRKRYEEHPWASGGEIRSLEYCVEQCESMANDLLSPSTIDEMKALV